ncbi:MAG TPA: hypothetical protein VJ806_11835 [Luteimonas sp.]|nr:hypothetical protein [Luteimonas sp.]
MTEPVLERPVNPPVEQRTTTDPNSVPQADIDRAVTSFNPQDGLDLLRQHPELAPQIADSALRHGNFSLAHAAQTTPANGQSNNPIGALPPYLTGTGFGLTAASAQPLGPLNPVAPVTLTSSASPPLRTIPMLSAYNTEHLPNNNVWGSQVRYLTPEESAGRKLTIGADGKLYDAAGKLFDTTKASAHGGPPGRVIFVMDQHGNIYTSLGHEAHPGKFHHSSLLAGHDVAMAGELEVKNGQLKFMNNQSGHYQPPNNLLTQAQTQLKAQGLDFSQASVEPSRFAASTEPRMAPRAAPMTPEGKPFVGPVVDPAAPKAPVVADPAAPKAPVVDPVAPKTTVPTIDPAVTRASQIADVAGKVGRPLIVVGAAVDAYNLYNADNKVEEGSRIAGGWAGAWAGGTLGAKGGAVVGTFIGGPVGTVVGGIVGGVVGGVVGYIAGSEVGKAAYDALKEPVGAVIDTGKQVVSDIADGAKKAWNSIFG